MAQIKNVYRSATIDCIIVQRHTRHEQGNAARRMVLHRREQDTAGYWHTSTRFRIDDIPELMVLLSRAYRTLNSGEPEVKNTRPVDIDLSALDSPGTRELHDAILASQIRR